MADIVHLYWKACRMLGTHEKFVRDPRHKSRPAPHWTSHMIGHKNNKIRAQTMHLSLKTMSNIVLEWLWNYRFTRGTGLLTFSPLSNCKNFSCVPKIEAYITRLLRLLPFPSLNLRPRYRALNVNACYAFLPSPRASFSRVSVSHPIERMRKQGLLRFLPFLLLIVKQKRLVRLLPFPRVNFSCVPDIAPYLT